MVANTVPDISPDPSTPAPGELPERSLWQVPVFLVGVIALGLVLFLRQSDGHRSPRHLNYELAQIRRHLAKQSYNPDDLILQTETLLEQPDDLGNRLGDTHYLLGSALVRKGDQGDPAQAVANYKLALPHLELAQKIGINPRDNGSLAFRLAKVRFHTGGDPQEIANTLAANIEHIEDFEKAGGCNLITEAYLRLPNPDYRSALIANERLRKDIALVPEAMLAPARVRGGELLLELGRNEDARKTLEHVSSAFPDSYKRARQLIARTYQNDDNWAEAARFYEQSLSTLMAGDEERPRVLYDLGQCYRKLDRQADAIRLWQECSNTVKQPYATAATFHLAEIKLASTQLEEAFILLGRLVADIKKPSDWNHSLVKSQKVVDAFEEALKRCRQANQFELALRALDSYEHMGVPTRTPLLRAEINSDWAQAILKEARQHSDETIRHQKLDRAKDLFRAGAAAYIQTANLLNQPAQQNEKADRLWDAIRCYREGSDHPHLLECMRTFFVVNTRDERSSEGWYLLGETHRQENSLVEAEKAFQDCVKLAVKTRFYFLANYQLALRSMENNRLDEAEAMLESNLTMLRNQPDLEAQEKTLFTLGEIYFRKRNYGLVVRRLQEALLKEEFRQNPMVLRAHFYLAESYYQLAIIENANSQQEGNKSKPETLEHFHQQYRSWMEKAAQEFADLAWMLDHTPNPGNQLTDAEKINIAFKAADCRFMLGKYDEALKSYQSLASRYHDQIEGLTALGGTVRCLSALHMDDEVSKRLAEMEKALNLINDPQLHEQWMEWMRRASHRPSTTTNPR